FLWQRFKAFFPTAEAKLRAMKPEEFAQLQQAVISQMLQAPQTLGDEASKLSKDFDRGNMRFDSRDKVVAQIQGMDPVWISAAVPESIAYLLKDTSQFEISVPA
ncbi:hypothetical protein JTM42_35970, partial [Pseudomonas aeruginosa]|nr:hypothetical protein [Pseudomonas aeruginosa]